MIIVSNIYKSFGSNRVLKGASFTLAKGALAALIGPSGVGKSVLLKIIAGIDSPDQGSVEYRDERDPVHISLMFQEGALFDSLSVFDNVAFPLVQGKVVASLPKKEKETVTELVFSILDEVGLAHAAKKAPGQLSGGMRKRVALARALVSRPEVVLLDDPTSGLDPVSSSVIMELIGRIHGEYHPTMLIVSHDLRRLLPVTNEIYALFDGRTRFEGTLEELKRFDCDETYKFVSCRYDLERPAC